MISNKIYNMFLILTILKSYKMERRISGGNPVTSEKGYVVYLIKAFVSPRQYDYWLCGGAIVSDLHIITSAACVKDVEYMYAIAGYMKYVPIGQIETDTCTKTMKKKVVHICVPKPYELDYAKIEKWAYIDIAVVKVESVFDFNDDRYTQLCTYKPKKIEINYDSKYQQPNIDSIVFGWGHEEQWRKCEEDEIFLEDKTRKSEKDLISRIMERQQMQQSRRQGICQNDHGGPLVTWVGSQEQLIGVASVFRVNKESHCTGPYLYTSTQCNGQFLDCVINSGNKDPNSTRRAICNKPARIRGFDLIERSISWKFHPDGPAENEFRIRPQRPIRP